MARKTYKKKRAAKRAAKGHEIYKVKGPPAGWRISQGRKVRGKRGRAQRRRKKAKEKRTVRSNLGNVYRSKKMAKRFARGRPVRKVSGGWKICRKS